MADYTQAIALDAQDAALYANRGNVQQYLGNDRRGTGRL